MCLHCRESLTFAQLQPRLLPKQPAPAASVQQVSSGSGDAAMSSGVPDCSPEMYCPCDASLQTQLNWYEEL